MSELSSVGRPVTRVDANAKARGSVTYGVDVRLPGMLVGKMLRSGIPHARILNIDISEAQRVPGVRAVITGDEHARLHGPMIKDQPPLARDVVRYAGEIVAAVAADTEEAAGEAIDRIWVDYEELPTLDDIDDALAEGAPLIHADHPGYERVETPGMRMDGLAGTNVPYHFKMRRGDVDRAFEEADLVVEDTFSTQFIQYCHLEPTVTIAQFDDLGMLTLWASTMGPHTLRNMMADLLEMPLSKVRVITNMVGGAYGGKMYLRAINPVAALLARKVQGRPVRVAFDRQDEFLTAPGRLPARIRLSTAARSDGTLLARRSEIHWNKGAYVDLGAMVARNAGYASLGPYKIPSAWIDAFLVYTNRQPGGAFRGLGVPQMAWAGEQQIDRVARELGMDPLEFRRKNILRDGDESVTGERMRSVGAGPCLDAVAAALAAREPESSSPGSSVGRGVAVVLKSTLTPTATFASVVLDADGSVDVLTAAVEHGQGSMTVLAQIVAEELKVPLDRVRVANPDTSYSPFDRSSSSSRTVFTMGNALKVATDDVRKQLLDMAASVMEISAADLELVDGKVQVVGAPERAVAYGAIMRTYYKSPATIVGSGRYYTKDLYDPMDPDTAHSSRPTAFWMYAAAGAEVEVDRDTGQVKVRRLITAVDAGKALNPQGCEQQVAGSAVMGYGMAMMEEVQFDDGRVVNPSFLDYKVPTTLDMPEMENLVVETATEEGPYGARGVGEPGVAPVPAAIGNAVFDATGVQIRELPLIAERVLRELQRSERDK